MYLLHQAIIWVSMSEVQSLFSLFLSMRIPEAIFANPRKSLLDPSVQNLDETALDLQNALPFALRMGVELASLNWARDA